MSQAGSNLSPLRDFLPDVTSASGTALQRPESVDVTPREVDVTPRELHGPRLRHHYPTGPRGGHWPDERPHNRQHQLLRVPVPDPNALGGGVRACSGPRCWQRRMLGVHW